MVCLNFHSKINKFYQRTKILLKEGGSYLGSEQLFFYREPIFRLTPLTSAAKRNQKLVNQKLCNTVLICDALSQPRDQCGQIPPDLQPNMTGLTQSLS